MKEDQHLWEGLMEGDLVRFRALYEKYYPALFVVGFRDFHDAELVKDAIQHLFQYLWEKRCTIQMATNVRGYLIASLMRKISSDWKRSGSRHALHLAWSSHTRQSDNTAEENIIQKDDQLIRAKILAERINSLPARKRELIVLKFYEGLSYEEIAEKTGLTTRTIYNRIHEALKYLKQEFEKDQRGYGTSLAGFIGIMVSSLTLNGNQAFL